MNLNNRKWLFVGRYSLLTRSSYLVWRLKFNENSLKFNDLPTRLTVSELEKQLFSRDFRLSLSKRPKKTLVNTRKGKLYLNMDYPFICFLLMFNNQVSHDHRRLFQASFRNCLNCVQNCDDHGLLDFKSAVQCMKHFIYHFICSINKANE